MTYPNSEGLPGQNLGALSADSSQSKADKRKGGKKPTKRVVNRQILIAAGFAIVIAVAALLLLAPKSSGTYVIEASRDIPALSPISVEMVKAVSVPQDSIVADAIQAADATEALALATEQFKTNPRVKYPIKTNQQITASDFGADLALDAPLTNGERLISISASVANGVAGQLTAGDSVDIIGTVDDASNVKVTGLLASNVPIVSVTVAENQIEQAGSKQTQGTGATTAAEALPANPIAPGIYVLRVSAEDATNIAAVQAGGKLTLLYRNSDSQDLKPELLSGVQALCKVNADSASCLAGN